MQKYTLLTYDIYTSVAAEQDEALHRLRPELFTDCQSNRPS